MILGTLALYQKRGVFYKEHQILSEDTYSKLIYQELSPKQKFKEPDLPNQIELTPVDEQGDTDYITAFYEDEGQAGYPYEVTIWLLIESGP